MYRNVLGILAVFAVALLLVGITFSTTEEGPADFTFVNGTEPKSLDPHIMTGQPEGRIADAIFEGLLYRDPKSLRPVPGVAREMPEISEDGRTYTFRLRPDVTWSDGTPITAHDFAWSWRRLQRPDLGSEYAYIQHMIKGARVYNTYGGNAEALRETILPAMRRLIAEHPGGVDGPTWQAFLEDADDDEETKTVVTEALEGVEEPVLVEALTFREGTLEPARLERIAEAMAREAERRQAAFEHAEAHYGRDEGIWAEDDHTFVVELLAPTPYFLDIVAFYSSHPVPRHVIEQEGNAQDWFMPDKIVSNGPYRLAAWRVNEKIRLVKNESYRDAASTRLDIIDALPIENRTTALNLYLTGSVDWLPSTYPVDLVDVLKGRPDFYKNAGLVVYYYRFNCTRPPFDDPRVRQAFSMAIDREVIVEEVLGLGQPPAYHLVPPGLVGYDQPESALRFDPEAARALLAEAGHPGGRGLPTNIGILYNTDESHEKIAETIADHLDRHLGVSVQPTNQEWQAYQATTQRLDYWMARAGWIGDYLDPNTFLDMWVTNGGNNQTGWSSAVYDQLLRGASDVEEFLRAPEPIIDEMKEPEKVRALIASLDEAGSTPERLAIKGKVRMHLLREAEAILVQDEFPICPIYFYVVSGMVKPNVTGFHSMLEMPDGTRVPNLQDIHPLRGIGVEREADAE